MKIEYKGKQYDVISWHMYLGVLSIRHRGGNLELSGNEATRILARLKRV